MQDVSLERLASGPSLIPGIHNYCDRRCERCRLRDRCSVYAIEVLSGGDGRDGERGIEATAATVVRSLRQAVGMLRRIAETHGLPEPTEEELDASDRETQAIAARTLAEPIVRSTRQYFQLAMPIVRVLRPVVLSRGDEAVIEAVETVEVLAPSVAGKAYRAVSQVHEDDFDPADLQSDANGSAKIARLVIADSRAAWQVLMELGRATADGVPAQLVARLDEIDAGLARRFPHAMEFVRPGFDEIAPGAPAGPGGAARTDPAREHA